MPEITSPVNRFPGTVTIPDSLTFPQAIAWERAGKAARALRANPESTDAEYWQAWMPGIHAVVEEWHLANFDHEKPPATPRLAVAQLVSWLVEEITALYSEADEVPNE